MTEEPQAEAVVNRLLREFTERLRERDLEGVLALFDPEAILFGSEIGESASGQTDLRLFFGRLFARPRTYGWIWDSLCVRSTRDIIWFVGPATAVVKGNDGSEQQAPYRLSGVLKRQPDGYGRLVLFNGSEPVPSDTA